MVFPLAVFVNPQQAVFFNHLKTDCSTVGQRFNVTENEVRISEIIWYNERKGDGFVKIDDSGRGPAVQTVRLPND